MNQPSTTIGLVVFPVALIARTIEPDLDSAAVSNVGVSKPNTELILLFSLTIHLHTLHHFREEE